MAMRSGRTRFANATNSSSVCSKSVFTRLPRSRQTPLAFRSLAAKSMPITVIKITVYPFRPLTSFHRDGNQW